MPKTLLITGSTDGLGLATAKALLADGHTLLLHGRNADKLQQLSDDLGPAAKPEQIALFTADLSELAEVDQMAREIAERVSKVDVVFNNAGIFKTARTTASNGIDTRFMVNTIAPWHLTTQLQPLLADDARVINLSSAAQAPVSLAALRGDESISDDFAAYAQSKLALTMWSLDPEALRLRESQTIVAVNPGSMLASKMVREGFGSAGKDLGIGVRILQQLATAEDAVRNRQYFDNDRGAYTDPHADALDPGKRAAVLKIIQDVVARR